MQLGKLLLLGGRHVLQRKMRSFLTTLGIAIGAMLVIAVISLNEGMRQAINKQLSSLGGDIITIMPHFVPGAPPASKFSKRDVEFLAKLPIVETAAGFITAAVEIEAKGKNAVVSAYGSDAALSKKIFEDMKAYRVDKGRYFRKGDHGKVVVGHDIAEDFNLKPGSKIKVNGREFEVIGVLAEIGNRQDDRAIAMTDRDLWDLLGLDDTYNFIFLKVKKVDEEKIKTAFKRFRGREDFEVLTSKNIAEKVAMIQSIINTIFVAMALISVLVGMVGVANTMYMAVLERFREIGIMRAVGATKRQILLVFLTEAGILGAIGGLWGSLMGILLAVIISWAARHLAGLKTLVPSLDPKIFVLAVVGGILIGIIAGIYPAKQASELEPVEALRSL